jgi:hypothetical protein
MITARNPKTAGSRILFRQIPRIPAGWLRTVFAPFRHLSVM